MGMRSLVVQRAQLRTSIVVAAFQNRNPNKMVDQLNLEIVEKVPNFGPQAPRSHLQKARHQLVLHRTSPWGTFYPTLIRPGNLQLQPTSRHRATTCTFRPNCASTTAMSTITRTLRNLRKVGIKVRNSEKREGQLTLTLCRITSCRCWYVLTRTATRSSELTTRLLRTVHRYARIWILKGVWT